MRLSGLVHGNPRCVCEMNGKHFMRFWDNESLVCLEDEMIYDSLADDYYLPKYILRNNCIVCAGKGMICI